MERNQAMNDSSAIWEKANSQEGRKLYQIFRDNPSVSFNDAVSKAEKGDYSGLKELIEQVMKDPEAKELVRKMRDSHE